MSGVVEGRDLPFPQVGGSIPVAPPPPLSQQLPVLRPVPTASHLAVLVDVPPVAVALALSFPLAMGHVHLAQAEPLQPGGHGARPHGQGPREQAGLWGGEAGGEGPPGAQVWEGDGGQAWRRIGGGGLGLRERQV